MKELQFKIFNGQFYDDPADAKATEWLKQHPDAVIRDWKYTHRRYGAHSICILVEVEKEADFSRL